MGAVQSHPTKLYKGTLCTGVALSALALVFATSGAARAQSADQLQAQIDALQRQVNQVKQQQKQVQAAAPAAPIGKAPGQCLFQPIPGQTASFCTPGGQFTLYGNFDVSFDYTSKNVKGLDMGGNTPPEGNFGWMPAISTNLSYFGVRGFQHLSDPSINFVYQLEAGFDVSATPSNKQSNSNLSDSVNGALFSRNSYIGLASRDYGAIKIGKT